MLNLNKNTIKMIVTNDVQIPGNVVTGISTGKCPGIFPTLGIFQENNKFLNIDHNMFQF